MQRQAPDRLGKRQQGDTEILFLDEPRMADAVTESGNSGDTGQQGILPCRQNR